MISTYEFLATWLRARFGDSDRGASLVEYALLVALIAVVCIAAIKFLGTTPTRASADRLGHRRHLTVTADLQQHRQGRTSGPSLLRVLRAVPDHRQWAERPIQPGRAVADTHFGQTPTPRVTRDASPRRTPP